MNCITQLWKTIKKYLLRRDNMNLVNNYYILDNKEFKNAFFIKPYNFNTNIDSNILNNNYNAIKKILNRDNINDVEVADGMITNLKNVGLAIKVADCQAIFLYDRVNKVIGNRLIPN